MPQNTMKDGRSFGQMFWRPVGSQILLNTTLIYLIVLAFQFTQAHSDSQSPSELKIKNANVNHFDFGTDTVIDGYRAIDHTLQYDPKRGYGWTKFPDNLRDRGKPNDLLRDMIFSRSPAVFRIDLTPGVYKFEFVAGDSDYGDHLTRISLPGILDNPLLLEPGRSEFITVTLAARVPSGSVHIEFDSPVNNWVVNAMSVERAEETMLPSFEHEHHRQPLQDVDTWEDITSWPDPIAPYWERFTKELKAKPVFEPTGLTRNDYLTVITGNVDYFKQYQNEHGAIVDPYRKVEFQYSTPCFALAAATLVVHAKRGDLLESAALAMDWSIQTLSQRRAATSHEDFFPPQIAHALMLLKSRIDPARYARWEQMIRSFDPFDTYRAGPGGGNWNVVALSGEGLFHLQNLRDDKFYVDCSVAAQGQHFNSPWGLYTEGPMAYDHFPRIWAADLLANGYEGYRTDSLAEVLRRGAITSLFMQSPAGELPTGGRSAHHQWNEAEQCVTYEVFAAKSLKQGDTIKAGTYKRAAHLALSSVLHWIRPSGELWIVKNRSDPSNRHGYEGYSSHSQYNLLAAAMLAIAYEHAAPTEHIAEQPAPADTGGFVLKLDAPFNKVIANASGNYLLIDYYADLAYNPTGLLRIHKYDTDPQIGPSDGLTEKAAYHLPDGPRTTAAFGVAWRDSSGEWRRLAEYGRYHNQPGLFGPLSVKLDVIEASTQRVVFDLTYTGNFDGPEKIIEHYILSQERIELKTQLIGYEGLTQMIWPVLTSNGLEELTIQNSNSEVRVSSSDSTQVFEPVGSETLKLLPERYGCRNGWARIAVAEFSNTYAILRISSENKQ